MPLLTKKICIEGKLSLSIQIHKGLRPFITFVNIKEVNEDTSK